MYIADMHCDTVTEIYNGKKKGEQIRLLSNHLQVDLEKMKKSSYLLQNFAIFTDMKRDGESPFVRAKSQILLFLEEMRKNAALIRLARTFEEIGQNQKDGLISAVLTLEEGEICEGSLEKLEEFYALGVRMMTFTWNYENSLANEGGLTETGIAFLEKMEALGVIPDVSHLSDAGFYDVCRYSTKPFAASHSNARALCGHKRNLTDDMIRKIAARGGVIGINYYGLFLEDFADGACDGKIARIADHALHMIRTGGIGCVGLGSDFDGFRGKTELSDCSNMDLLVAELKKRGLKHGELEAICYKNVLRLYRECLK